MKTVTIHEAKTHLSRLLREIESGEEDEIVIAHGRVPAARLLAYSTKRDRKLGMDDGLFDIPNDFDAPNPEIDRLFGTGQ